MEKGINTVLKEAANNAAILDCYRNIATRAIQELKLKKRKIAELEDKIRELKEQLKQPV